jgi:hypothetical protein
MPKCLWRCAQVFGVLWMGLLGACDSKPAAESYFEITGTQSERIAKVSQRLAAQAPLPGALLDAHFLEQQYGDGVMGPSDFTAYYALTVAPADLPAWQASLAPLEPLNASPTYAAPKQPAPWWMTREEFSQLQFYSPKAYTGRSHGWLGIVPGSGKIFIYAFTM